MEYRQLGQSGLRVPVLSFGTGTFGGISDLFKTWGNTGNKEATRLVDICLERGVNFFDTADAYSFGAAEEILAAALKGRRHQAIISTKAGFPMSDGLNDRGSSRYHLIKACEDSLKRLGTDYIDLYFIHMFDTTTPMEETLSTLAQLVASGKVRYIGCSNFAGWQLMKSLTLSDTHGWPRYVVYQGYYSLAGREYEWELMPLAKDQGTGLMVWSPLAWARLTGKIKAGQPLPEGRIKQGGGDEGPVIPNDYLFKVIGALEEVAEEAGKTVPQVAINWLLQQPTVSNVIIGARNEQQLLDNLGAVGWSLTAGQQQKLADASFRQPVYPYWVK